MAALPASSSAASSGCGRHGMAPAVSATLSWSSSPCRPPSVDGWELCAKVTADDADGAQKWIARVEELARAWEADAKREAHDDPTKKELLASVADVRAWLTSQDRVVFARMPFRIDSRMLAAMDACLRRL